jgi:hypothetical protein
MDPLLFMLTMIMHGRGLWVIVHKPVTSQSLLKAVEIEERNGPSRSTTGAQRRVKCYRWYIEEKSSPRRRSHHVLKKSEKINIVGSSALIGQRRF